MSKNQAEVFENKLLKIIKNQNNIYDFIVEYVNEKSYGTFRTFSKRLKEFRGLKLGKKLVEACIKEDKEYGIKQLLSLTYEQGFFESCGFRVISKEEIPEHKIWADCIRCKHFPICDEIAMVIDL